MDVVWAVILCCDYIVDEFAVIFCIFSKKFTLKLLIFSGVLWPPKIRNTIFDRRGFLVARRRVAES
jgi:hypothetical protein